MSVVYRTEPERTYEEVGTELAYQTRSNNSLKAVSSTRASIADHIHPRGLLQMIYYI